MSITFALLTAFLVSFITNLVMVRRPELLPLDNPNERSLHSTPVPRSGGLGVVIGVIAATLPAFSADWSWLLLLIFALAAMSLIDDLNDLPALVRISGHFLAAFLFLLLYLPDDIGWLSAVLALITIVWMTNLYNFMDGSDGLAGGMALIGFGMLGFAAWIGDDHSMALMCWGISVAAAGFLIFNFHPAKIFMGDIGSIPLGFAAGALSLAGVWRELWPLSFPLLVFSPFIIDATTTLLRRMYRGEKVWQAHKTHYYQRLIQMGLGHKRTALLEYLLMLCCGISGLVLISNINLQLPLLGGWLMLYAGCMYWIDVKWKRHEAH